MNLFGSGKSSAMVILMLMGCAVHAQERERYDDPQTRMQAEEARFLAVNQRTLGLAIVDRDSGEELRQYQYRGQVFVAGRPGARYAVRMSSRAPNRLLAVMSVDGINVITGKTSSYGDSGYVVPPGFSQEITGWRKSDQEVAAFEFARLSNSYAARTGRPDNVGVIGVAIFSERPRIEQPASRADSANAARGAAMEKSSPSAPAAAAAESLGTGHGERETSIVNRTTFERASQTPNQILSVRYDTYDNLVAQGVIKPERPRVKNPNPFPRSAEIGYVPDPPIR